MKLLSVLHFGIFEAGYLDDIDAIFDVFEALAWIDNPQEIDCVARLIPDNERTPENAKIICLAMGVCEENEESEDTMCKLKVEYIAGKPYLELDCGCGSSKYFALSESAIDPITGQVESALDSVPGYITPVELSGTTQTCFDQKQVDIIVNALKAFTDAVFNYAVGGAAVFAPVQTTAFLGAVEIQQTLVKILNGELSFDGSTIGYTATEVKAQFDSTAFRTWLTGRFGQTIGRFGLLSSAQKLLFNNALNFPTPIHPVYQSWAWMANIEALNNALAIAANECATGNSLVYPYVPAQEIVTFTSDFTVTGQTQSVSVTPNTDTATFTWSLDAGDPGSPFEAGGFNVTVVCPDNVVQFDVRVIGRTGFVNWYVEGCPDMPANEMPAFQASSPSLGTVNGTLLEQGYIGSDAYAVYRLSVVAHTGGDMKIGDVAIAWRQCAWGVTNSTTWTIENVVTA